MFVKLMNGSLKLKKWNVGMNFELGDLLFVCCLVIFYEFKVEIIVYLLRKLLIFCYICKIISFILS